MIDTQPDVSSPVDEILSLLEEVRHALAQVRELAQEMKAHDGTDDTASHA